MDYKKDGKYQKVSKRSKSFKMCGEERDKGVMEGLCNAFPLVLTSSVNKLIWLLWGTILIIYVHAFLKQLGRMFKKDCQVKMRKTDKNPVNEVVQIHYSSKNTIKNVNH